MQVWWWFWHNKAPNTLSYTDTSFAEGKMELSLNISSSLWKGFAGYQHPMTVAHWKVTVLSFFDNVISASSVYPTGRNRFARRAFPHSRLWYLDVLHVCSFLSFRFTEEYSSINPQPARQFLVSLHIRFLRHCLWTFESHQGWRTRLVLKLFHGHNLKREYSYHTHMKWAFVPGFLPVGISERRMNDSDQTLNSIS